MAPVDRRALLLSAAVIAALFLFATRAPLRMGTDSAMQVLAVEQWARGTSPTPFHLTTADPARADVDRHQWVVAWPPALPTLLVVSRALGWQATTSLRLLDFASLVLGALGWLLVARRCGTPPGQTLVFATLLGLRAASAALGAPAYSFYSMDPAAYAVVPWVLMGLERSLASPGSTGRFLLLGLATGSVALVKYSALFATAGAAVAFIAIRGRGASEAKRVLSFALGVAAPMAALTVTYRLATGASPATFHAQWARNHANALADIVLGAATSLGRGVFDVSFPLVHFFVIGSPAAWFTPGWGFLDRIRLYLWLGLPLTLAVVWLLVRARRSVPASWWWLIIGATATLVTALTVMGVVNGFNYFNHEAPRYLSGVAPGLELLILRALSTSALWSRRSARISLMLALFAGPAVSAAYVIREIHRSPAGRGTLFALPPEAEVSRPLLDRVSREARAHGSVVALEWDAQDLPLALSMPNRLFFPQDSVRWTFGPSTDVVLIAPATHSDVPPAAATVSFEPATRWRRDRRDTSSTVGIWHAIPPKRAGVR